MGRRNIAKTAIEGGRYSFNRYCEKQETKKERRAYRNYCSRSSLNEDTPEPVKLGTRGHVTGRQYREFADKLNPVRRWLRSHVSRPWNSVVSEIKKKFDSRSLAGRHIIDHIYSMVTLPNDPWYVRYPVHRPRDLYVDDGGVLRQAGGTARRH